MEEKIGAAGEGLPTFDAVLARLEEYSELYTWSIKYREQLKQSFESNLSSAFDQKLSLDPFSAEKAEAALRRLAYRENGKKLRSKFVRPCCTKRPFIYPFCNPNC